ncbi:diadenylate cyclase [Siphonobacter sp. SORGH_AS_1065]|uniref:diadenylate cyclase n=1 Tax=Siphonobacter sp. SORGH_AS_1065 TaxID=3041795 RepID=UPI0027803D90|nr:diadenylate cyclase [Siphonobacter sp. SORGH_AS_1065]MDQ1089436.1 DNA integrity scanning protein DisA with diadenylate cyclase activity [Siphonobacter sp. SORGH_AS_1065]
MIPAPEQTFQVLFELYAKRLFALLDVQFEPLVSIICIPEEEGKAVSIITSGEKVNPEAFEEVKLLASALEKVDIESRLNYSNKSYAKTHKDYIKSKSLGEAVHKILNRELYDSNIERFISGASLLKGYQLFVVLELNKNTLDKFYSLKKDTYLDYVVKSKSFIHSVITLFLKECIHTINSSKVNTPHSIIRAEKELMINAAKDFMHSVAMSVEMHEALVDLYEVCNSISSLKYEGSESIGKMVIAKQHHMNVSLVLELEEPISIYDYRKVRKFLEVCNDETLIVSDSYRIYGLGKITGTYNANQESLFVINFKSHYVWEVLHDDKVMMIVDYQIPALPKERIDREDFHVRISRIFKDISEGDLNSLWEICTVASEQKHGTMLVISDQAESEAKRLSNQCFCIKPRKLEASLMKQITSIDGSVLLDKDSVCYAIGVILDGMATKNGDSSRGARFNSAIRYYDYVAKEIPTVIVIVSEDGMIDLIPNLMPKIHHKDIEEAIKKLREMETIHGNRRHSYNKLMNYFREHSFYLTEEECNIINTLSEKLGNELTEEGLANIDYGKFQPNSDMNDSYYLD